MVARAYVDGLVRNDGMRKAWGTSVMHRLAAAEKATGAARRTALTALAAQLDKDATGVDATRVKALAQTVRDIAAGR